MCVIQIKGVCFTWLSRRVSFDCYNDGYNQEKRAKILLITFGRNTWNAIWMLSECLKRSLHESYCLWSVCLYIFLKPYSTEISIKIKHSNMKYLRQLPIANEWEKD